MLSGASLVNVDDAEHYLCPDAICEPLVNHWYAWTYLLSPATAAMLTANLHIKILQSFLEEPELHRRAAADPGMRGSMVVDHRGPLEPIQELLSDTLSICGDGLRFASAVNELTNRLNALHQPLSLAPIYAEVPPRLRGLVELTYDLRHRVDFRFIERLLYKTALYNEGLQAVALSLNDGRERPFAISTPRFADDQRCVLRVPFRSRALDRLFEARSTPMSHGQIEELAQFLDPANNVQQLRSLFTTTAPAVSTDSDYSGNGVRLRYFGHASVLMQTSSVSILVDPLLSYTHDGEQRDRFTIDDLPGHIDYVLLTHSHQDHVYLESLLQIRHRTSMVVVPRCAAGVLQDPSLKLMLESIGFERVIELDELESLDVPLGKITGIPFLGEHADLDIRAKLGYHVQLLDRSFLFMADSAALEPALYKRIAAAIGKINALFVGLECDGAPLTWLYGPLFSDPVPRAVDQSRRLNSTDCAGAMRMIEAFNPDRVFVYAMGLEPWLGHISSISYTSDSRPIREADSLLKACNASERRAQRLFMLHEELF